MCLEIFVLIAPEADGRLGARRLSDVCGLQISNEKFEGQPALHFSATGGCSCDFLGDDASPEAAVWELAHEHLPALADTLAFLAREVKRFGFIARWYIAPSPTEVKQVSAGALVEMIRRNRVGNNILYRVG
jgi:hypothetical protein